MRSETRTALVAVIVIALSAFPLALVHGEALSIPYWCGEYGSPQPCTYGGYGYGHEDKNNPLNSYYTYPNQYYPSNYNFYFPSQSKQFYYQSS
jgi:hypothetical protein